MLQWTGMSIPVVVTAPAAIASVNVPRPTNSNGARVGDGTLAVLLIAPVSTEPLFLSIWAGVDAPFAAGTRLGGGPIPIKDTQNVVPLGFPLPTGATIRISTDAAATVGPAALKICAFYYE